MGKIVAMVISIVAMVLGPLMILWYARCQHYLLSWDTGKNTTWRYFPFACMYGHVETVRLLIELGAKPDVQAAGLGRTPMSLAETNGYIEVVQILKDAGAKD